MSAGPHGAAPAQPAPSELVAHLAASGLAGSVATTVSACLANCRRLMAGDPDYTFGLSDWRRAAYADAVAALAACGVSLAGAENPDATAFIEPASAVAGIGCHRDHLARLGRSRARVIIATGHAFALLPHYAALGRGLEAAGCSLLEPLGGVRDRFRLPGGEMGSIRYFDGVASLVVHGNLRHTHRPDYMEAMLAEAGGAGQVDAVIADHGFAGAAVEAGVLTLSIADVNDPALPLAQARGRTDAVLVIDDGLNPVVYEPLTAAMLAGLPAWREGRARA